MTGIKPHFGKAQMCQQSFFCALQLGLELYLRFKIKIMFENKNIFDKKYR